MFKRFTISEVRKYVEENSECKLLSTEYVNARTKLKFQCKCGNIFERTLDGFKSGKTTLCQPCSNKRKMPSSAKKKIAKSHLKPLNSVIALVEKSGLEYIDRYVKHNTRSTVLIVKCPIHGKMEVYYSNLRQRFGCPICNEYNKQQSKNMNKVEKWLNKNKIQFVKEMKFAGCKDKRPLPFDYYLSDKNICIEVDGRQHFEKAYFGGVDELKAEQGLKYTKRHDEIKNKFCRQNNIELIRIPYFKENEISNILKNALL